MGTKTLRQRLLLLVMLFGAVAFAQPTKNIAFVLDNYSPGYLQIQKEMRFELGKILGSDFNVDFPKHLQINGKNNYRYINEKMQELMRTKRCDLIITIGYMASHVGAHYKKPTHPILATTIIDKKMQKLTSKAGHSNHSKRSYMLTLPAIDLIVEQLKSLEEIQHVTLIVDRNLHKYAPKTSEYLTKLFKRARIKTNFLSLSHNLSASSELISGDTDLVVVLPQLQLTVKERKRFYSLLAKRKLKSLSLHGHDDVMLGALFGTVSEGYIKRLVRQSAFQANQFLMYKNGKKLDVDFITGNSLSLNVATSKKVGYLPTWNILSSANLVNENYTNAPLLSIDNVMKLSLLKNLDIQAQNHLLEASQAQAKQANSPNIPQINVDLAWLTNDEDRAKASLGSLATSQVDATFLLNYTLYSIRNFASAEFHQLVSESKDFATKQLKLDIALSAGIHFLQLSKLKKRIAIEKKNLQLTQKNLQLAKLRKRIGVSSKSDIYRWENKISADKQRLIFSHAAYKREEHALNALMNLPQNIALNLAKVTNQDPIFLTHHTEIFEFIKEPKRFAQLEGFMVDEALKELPRVEEFHTLQTARETLLKADRRALFLPVVSLQAGLTQHLNNDIQGTKASELAKVASLSIEDPDDTDYTLQVTARFPVFSGGYDTSAIQKAQANYLASQMQFASIKQNAERQVRNTLYQAKASYLSMQLAKDAQESANKNYELYASIYRQGNSDILHLLDAQEVALKSEIEYNERYYTFMQDLLRLQYSIGRIDFTMSESTWNEWLSRLKQHK